MSAPACPVDHFSTTHPAPRTSHLFAIITGALLLLLCTARAVTPEDEYLKIFDQIQQADKLITGAKTNAALAKYQEAQVGLNAFRKAHPDLLVSTIRFRLNYVTDKIATLTAKPPMEPLASTGSNSPATVSSALKVSLLEAGAEPRKVLRIHPKPGDKQTVTMTSKTDTEVTMPGAPSQPSKAPALKLTMAATVKSVSPEGDVVYDFVYEDATFVEEADTPPQVGEQLKPILALLKGTKGTGTMTARGTHTIAFESPAGNDAITRQAVDQLGHSFLDLQFVLPEEPVGPGAKWLSQLPSKSQGVAVDETTTNELVSIDGERVSVKGTVIQEAAKQKIQNPALPGGAVDLDKMTGKGVLEYTLDLTQLYPSELKVESQADMSMMMEIAGQKQSISTATKSKVQLAAQVIKAE
jgi:hypothetical protein